MTKEFDKWKVHVAGYKNWKIVLPKPEDLVRVGVIQGEEVEEDIIVEAKDRFEAEELAIIEFEKKGYFFDEVVRIEPIGKSVKRIEECDEL